jgi:hypothetical protein
MNTIKHTLTGPAHALVIRINPERTFIEVLIGIDQGWFNGAFERIIHIKDV